MAHYKYHCTRGFCVGQKKELENLQFYFEQNVFFSVDAEKEEIFAGF